jgi:hypothetical protein
MEELKAKLGPTMASATRFITKIIKKHGLNSAFQSPDIKQLLQFQIRKTVTVS